MKYEDIPKDAIVDGWVVGNDYVVEGTYKKTCQQCIHFYEREPKPWRTMADIGYCDHSREGKIEINKYCPVNKWCDNKFEPKEDSRGKRKQIKPHYFLLIVSNTVLTKIRLCKRSVSKLQVS